MHLHMHQRGLLEADLHILTKSEFIHLAVFISWEFSFYASFTSFVLPMFVQPLFISHFCGYLFCSYPEEKKNLT